MVHGGSIRKRKSKYILQTLDLLNLLTNSKFSYRDYNELCSLFVNCILLLACQFNCNYYELIN